MKRYVSTIINILYDVKTNSLFLISYVGNELTINGFSSKINGHQYRRIFDRLDCGDFVTIGDYREEVHF